MSRTEPLVEPAVGTGSHSEVDGTVDIAIPVYRRVEYLGEAIDSVRAQTHEEWSLTVFDNGPGGGAIEATVSGYLSDPRISYRPTGEVLPVAENWTRAINHGSAPFVALLHDDDRWHPDYLRARVEALRSHADCAFAFGEFVHVEGGAEIDRSPVRFREGPLSRELLAEWFTRECIAKPPTILVRRSAYEAVGARFDERWAYCDWEMWARLASRFPAYYVARHDSDFRRHLSTQSASTRVDPAQYVAMLDSIEAMFGAEVPGFRLSRLGRARNRAQTLMSAARDVHPGGGWNASRRLYARALREYPPVVLGATSLRMIAYTFLGRRRSGALGRWLRRGRSRRAAHDRGDRRAEPRT